MRDVLEKYIPEKALNYVVNLLKKYPCTLKIKSPRTTKLGDFRFGRRDFQITINNNLSKEQFLLTLIHEIAHLLTYLQHKNKVKPHGEEWQDNFRILMYPLLNIDVFEMKMLPHLFNYFKKPKASSCSDKNLHTILQGNTKTGKTIFDMPEKTEFTFKNKTFKLLTKKRTRAICEEIGTGQRYFISGHAIVE